MFGSMLIAGYDEVKKKPARVYVIRNGKIADIPGEVKFKVPDIAGASFETMMTWQGYGDIYRFASLAKYEGMDFYFGCIPYEFSDKRKSEFDPVFMRKLFYRGYRTGMLDDPWFKTIKSKDP
jgi:hypothetical protein